MFYAFCHNWSIVLCETKSKLFPARIPNYQAVFRKVWILYKFGFVEMCITGCLMELWVTLFAGRGKLHFSFSMLLSSTLGAPDLSDIRQIK